MAAQLGCWFFFIKTDHQPLRHLLDQRLTTQLQKKATRKLLGLSYTISYKQGSKNKVADALSRRDEEVSASMCAVLAIEPKWLSGILASYEGDVVAQQLLSSAAIVADGSYKVVQGALRYKDRLFVGSSTSLRRQLIDALHNSPMGGHSGIQTTYQRLKILFYWPGLKGQVEAFVKACDNCQRNKVEHVRSLGLLQPLELPMVAWHSIRMDFVEALPKSTGFDTILVFTSAFGKDLFAAMGTKLHMSTAYHPQSDGQTEHVN